MIVQIDDLWVTANFKETQLVRMRHGQHARIYVDALRQEFNGTVESMPAVTGSRTSVLPPENATGNYVKVIQRLPVRIRFDAGQTGLDKLRPGMSVEPKVQRTKPCPRKAPSQSQSLTSPGSPYSTHGS